MVMTEERVSELEDKLIEFIHSEPQRETWVGDNGQSLGDLWDSTQANTCVTKVPVEEKEYSEEKIFEQIMAENFPSLAKDRNLQIKEVQ